MTWIQFRNCCPIFIGKLKGSFPVTAYFEGTDRLWVKFGGFGEYRDTGQSGEPLSEKKIRITVKSSEHQLIREFEPGELTTAGQNIGTINIGTIPNTDMPVYVSMFWYEPFTPPPPTPPTPPPPPSERTGTVVTYWSDGDAAAALIVSNALDVPMIRVSAPEDFTSEINSSQSIVVVGAQIANPLFKLMVDEGVFQPITASDVGLMYIQKGVWNSHDVYGVAGWHAADTIASAELIKKAGQLPSTTIRTQTYEPPAPKTELQKAWTKYFDDPDIIKTLGVVSISIQESFSRVFTGYSIINDAPADPEPGDYAAVGLIIAGLVLAGVTLVVAAMPTTPAWAGALDVPLTGVTATGLKGVIGTGGLTAGKIPGLGKLAMIMMGIMMVQQLDIVCWGFGYCPAREQSRVQKLVSSARSSLITLDKKVRNKEWASAKAIADQLKPQITETKTLIESYDAGFWAKSGFSLNDIKVTFNTMEAEYDAYIADYPLLKDLPPHFPEEVVVDDVQVEDGDTIFFPGHPEVQERIRFIGIDAHESGTTAGKEETEYLKSLIEGQQVIFKVDPYNQIGLYGRLLAVPFLGDQNIIIAMLRQFGKDIFTATKYHDKHKFVDWDELKREAAEATGPGVKEFMINITSAPSNAKLFIDGIPLHHNTPSDTKELSDVIDLFTPGEHIIKATRAGMESSTKVTLTPGPNPDILLTLQVVGLEPVEPGEIPPTEFPTVEKFTFNVISTPSRAKLYIDGIYTHHLTPSDANELKDVLHLLTPGMHTFKVTKTGKESETKVDVKPGTNEPIYLTLGVVGLPVSKEIIESEIASLTAKLQELKDQLALL